MKTPIVSLAACLLLTAMMPSQAGVLPEAQEVIKLALAKKPTTRPMGVAYVPDYKRYYVADGGLGAVEDGMNMPVSKSEVHVFGEKGEYLQSAKPGLDNRSIYFNRNTNKLEAITYNVSSDAGFSPNSGVFAIELDDKGDLTRNHDEISNFNPAFGDAATMPSYDSVQDRYLAKQERSDKVFIVKLPAREKVGVITLNLAAAGVKSDDISDHFVAWTGIVGEELAVLDIDHKAILVFDQNGKFVGRSALPAGIKLRAQNHYNGLGYTNGLFFVYSETEGEFGTYRSFRVSDQVQ
jgi:hypothetical protein